MPDKSAHPDPGIYLRKSADGAKAPRYFTIGQDFILRRLIGQGKTACQIADELGVSPYLVIMPVMDLKIKMRAEQEAGI